MTEDETCWNEVWSDMGLDEFRWQPRDLSDCHPGDLVRVNSSDGPGEPFVYTEPPPMFDNLGAMDEPELAVHDVGAWAGPETEREDYEVAREDGKRSLSLRLTAFSPHRPGPAACPWCGEPFGPYWFVTERAAPGTLGFERATVTEHWFEVTCPRCSWTGVFDRSATKTT